MSNVPRAVQEAEAKADRLQQELIAQQQQPPSDAAPTDQTTGQALSTDQQATQAPAPKTGSPPPAPADDWEHRFKVLQGKYSAEVPRFAAENKDLKSRLETLEHELEQMKAKPTESLVKQEEIDEYGPGLVDLARRIAREEQAQKDTEITTLKRQIAQLSEDSTKTAKNDFFKSLNAIVSDWEQINEDPGFIKWLEEVDDLTGETKQNLLSRAEVGRDAARVGKFFTSYKKATSSWAASSAQSLESQVVPSTNKSPDTPPSKKVWTRAEITGFYGRMRRGDVSDKDAIAIEADITAASIEGRIR
ncbi:MAG: hypothetical protein HQ446_06270 [Polaromonas sp.]|nr:hypothetical protein [Polaromonas sp.]